MTGDGKARSAFIAALGSAAVLLVTGLGSWVWLHRVELIEIPAAWREVQHIQEHGPPPTEERDFWGRAGLDKACVRLLSMQDDHSFYVSCVDFHLQRLRSRDGETRTLGCCIYADGVSRRYAFVLDARGRILDPTMSPYPISDHPTDWRDYRVEASKGGFEVLRLSSADPLLVWEYSIDRRGLVPHGLVTADDLAAPVDSSR